MYRFKLDRRSKGGQPAGQQVAYLKREKDAGYMQRTTEATVGREDLRHMAMGNLPAWAQGDAAIYFTAAEKYERRNGYYAVALQIALPRALTHDQHLALTQDFIDATMNDKVYLVVKHEPVSREDGLPQPHLHVLVGLRTVDDIIRTPEQTFRRWHADAPEKGGCQKDLFWSRHHAARQLRYAFSDLANYHLERAGVEERIDPRGLWKQGITRSRIDRDNRSRPDAQTLKEEQAQVRLAWEQRKGFKKLGNVQEIGREEVVLLVRQEIRNGAQKRVGSPGHDPTRGEVEQALASLQTQQRTLDAELRIVERALDRPLPRLSRGVSRGREERSVGVGLRVRLEEEQTYGR